MVRRLHLLSGVTAALVVASPLSAWEVAHAAGGVCGGYAQTLGACSTGDAVEIRERRVASTPGRGAPVPSPARPAGDPVGGTESSTADADPAEPMGCIYGLECARRVGGGAFAPFGTQQLLELEPAEPEQPLEPTAEAEAPQVVTAEDVERFLPTSAVLHSEPDGWAVVGVPANFWVEVEPVTVEGELLGEVAEVRFTPRAYRWDYGDGIVRVTSTPGASWNGLGQQELTETPTGHIYEERGDRNAVVDVAYSAQYRLGGGDWLEVLGTVTGQAPPEQVLVVVERTVLTPP